MFRKKTGDSMSFIQTTAPHEACGEVADLYRRLQDTKGHLPNYARVFCHRPDVMVPLGELQETLKRHMKPRLWALVSLAAAREIRSSYCGLAFARRLLRSHFSPPELLAILSGQADAPLQADERAAMVLAAKVARDSSTVSREDIDRMRGAGFTDAGIFDVVAAAAWRCFFAKVPDALGALPDTALTRMDPPLLQHLVVGRSPENITTDDRGPSQPRRHSSDLAEQEEAHHEHCE
jgi:alkylhydroperoxidase family enzyme